MENENMKNKSDNTIAEMLRERGSRYGDFKEHALITQKLLEVPEKHAKNWADLPDYMKEAIHMNFHKLGRILNGDPFYIDSWVDIVGYMQLVVDILQELKQKQDAEFEKQMFVQTSQQEKYIMKEK